jgi:hypothetical protein
VSRAQRSMKCCAAEPGPTCAVVKSWTPDLRRNATSS